MWSSGTIWTESKAGYDYWVKHFEEGSEFGIEQGRISKLTIRRHGDTKNIANYDRGWDIEVPDDKQIKEVYAVLIKKYN